MIKTKLFWWTDRSDLEWLSFKFNKWAAHCQGYTKLHSSRISRGCQTMMERPEDPSLAFRKSSHQRNINRDMNEANLLDTRVFEEEETQCPAESNTSMSNLFNDQEISDYVEYLNRPIINMNDHYIEIQQYHFSEDMLLRNRPPRRKHQIDTSSTEIVNTTALESYSDRCNEFLVKKKEVNGNVKKLLEAIHDLDEHRELKQSLHKQSEACCMKRGHTFTPGSLNEIECVVPKESKHFLSFRMSKKNKSGRRKKKVVVGEKGLDGPIWPGVLLTFDRAVSPGPCEEDEFDV